MTRTPALAAALLVALATAGTASAEDYERYPELLPENRCVDDEGRRFDPASADEDGNTPAGLDPIHCQRMFWDLPATTVGTVRVGAPFHEDLIPRFSRGVTDRPPPLYVDDDGNGHELPGDGRRKLCEGIDDIPWWEPIFDEEGAPVIGTDENGYHDVDDPTLPQEGPLFRIACRRGSRAYMGPWQIGRDPDEYDKLMAGQFVRFENSDRLTRDIEAGLAADEPDDPLFEWSKAIAYYNHFGSHHATCYFPNSTECHGVGNYERSDVEPGGKCWEGYQREAEPGGSCHAKDADPECTGVPGNGAYRRATQIPGRSTSIYGNVDRGFRETEDQIWRCNHHVVHQLPPGSYGMDRLADFRLQAGGVENPRVRGETCEADADDPDTTIDETRSCFIYGVDAGEVFGGAVGQLILNNFTAPAKGGTKPLNMMFNAIGDLATTAYPPFTWNYHTSLWYPPFDAAIVVGAIHSHHRMVKGTMDVLPRNPPRTNSTNIYCGGAANGQVPDALYVNWEWEDARNCDWAQEPDGPVIIRKGQAWATTCFVNNGVTPEAIKHGLVAGSMVESLKALGAPIPDYPELVPASSWGDALVNSPVGDQLLYGTHPPINYRVVYKCTPTVAGQGTPFTASPTGEICDPNPAADVDGDYIDGPYLNELQCGAGGYCAPSTIMFRCVGEDEMCIGVLAYYALPRIGDVDDGDAYETEGEGSPATHDEAMENLQEGDLDGVGTPGKSPVSSDVIGDCPECNAGL